MEELKYSLIIPVYKNELNIPTLLRVLAKNAKPFGRMLEIIFVVDGSPDLSAALLVEGLAKTELRSSVISLSRNFGSFSAIRAGMQKSRGSYIAVMAADLQEPFDLVKTFFFKLENNNADVVIGVRTSRKDSKISEVQSKLFWSIYRKTINKEIPLGGVDVFGCTRGVKDQILEMKESHSSLLALLFWVGFNRESVDYSRQERVHGTSSWTFNKKFTYMLDSVFSFTDLPVRIILGVGSVGSALLVAVGLLVVCARAMNLIDVPGYSALAFIISLSTSAILFGLGVVGNYAWRTFENSKNRPLYIISGEKKFNE